jgi:hypothetical protein
MKNYKPLSVIKLPEPTEEQIQNWVGENHPKEHYIAAWQLFQIQMLLQDFAFAAPHGFKVKIAFTAHSEGDEVRIDKINAEYNRWLYG